MTEKIFELDSIEDQPLPEVIDYDIDILETPKALGDINPDEGSVTAGDNFLAFIASDILRASADTERTGTEVDYTKVKQITTRKVGTLRIKFDLKRNAGIGTVYGKIYVDGTEVGTERSSATSGYETFSEDITISGTSGDTHTVQLYARRAGANDVYAVKNFRLYWNVGVFPIFTVDTD